MLMVLCPVRHDVGGGEDKDDSAEDGHDDTDDDEAVDVADGGVVRGSPADKPTDNIEETVVDVESFA